MVAGAFPLCGDAERAMDNLKNTGLLETVATLIYQAYRRILEETVVALAAQLLFLFCCVQFVETQWGSGRALLYAVALFLVHSIASLTIACLLELALLTPGHLDEAHMARRGSNAEPPEVIRSLGGPWGKVF